jgi:hypothetical protein
MSCYKKWVNRVNNKQRCLPCLRCLLSFLCLVSLPTSVVVRLVQGEKHVYGETSKRGADTGKTQQNASPGDKLTFCEG